MVFNSLERDYPEFVTSLASTARTRRPGSLPNGWLTFTC